MVLESWSPRALRGTVLLLALLAMHCKRGSSTGRGTTNAVGPAVWGQVRGDGQQRGRSEAPGTPDGNAAWVADIGSAVTGAVGIDGRGDLRVKPASNELIGLSADGRRQWAVSVGPGARSPVIDSFGGTWVGTDDGTIVRVDADGRVSSRLSVGTSVGPGLLYTAGTVLFPGADGRLFFLDLAVELLFTLQVGGVGQSAPVLVNSGQIFVASVDGNLYEIQIDLVTKEPIVGTPIGVGGAVSRCTPVSDGRAVYVVTDADVLVRVFEDRFDEEPPRIVWQFDPGTGASDGGASSPALGRDGTLYYGTVDGRLFAIGEDGGERWSVDLGSPVRSSPLLDAADNVYLRSADGVLHSFTAEGVRRFRRDRSDPNPGGIDPSPSMDTDGNLLFGTHDGQVLRLGSTPLNAQVGHDAAHSAAMGVEGPENPLLRWTVDTGAPAASAPRVLGDASLLVHGTDGVLRRYSREGTLLTSVGVGSAGAHVSLGESGRILVTTAQGTLAVYTAAGTFERSTELVVGGSLSPPTVRADGAVFIGSQSGRLFQLSPAGELERSVALGGAILTPPALTADGGVVLATALAEWVELDSEWTERSRSALPDSVTRAAPVVDDDGLRFFVTDRDVLLAFDDEGVGRWLFDPGVDTSEGGHGGLVLGRDGTLVFAAQDGVIRSFERSSGALLFTTDLGADVRAPIVRDAEGRIYVATADASVHVLSATGARLAEVPGVALAPSPVRVAPVLAGDRALVLHAEDGTLSLVEDGVAWGTFHGAPDFRGRASVVGPRAPVVDWSLTLGEELRRSVLVDGEGRSLAVGKDGGVFVVGATGALERQTSVASEPAVPALLERGRSVIGADGGVLAAYDATLSSEWFLVFGGALADVNRTTGGDLLALTADGRLRRITDAGSVRWNVGCTVPGRGGPALGADGVVRVVGVNGTLQRFDLDGNELSSTALPGPCSRTSPVALPDGGTILTTDADVLVRLDERGDESWTFDPLASGNAGGDGAPALFADGAVAFGTQDGDLHIVEGDGSLRFTYAAGAPIHRAVVLDAEGVVYVCPDDGFLHAVDRDGNLLFTFDPTGGGAASRLTTPAFAADGTVRVGSENGVLYSVR